jgi:leukotriene-A4 hydrolase
MRRLPAIASMLTALLLTGGPAAAFEDPHSYSQPDLVSVKHLHLDLRVDFAAKQLVGRATLTLDRKQPTDKLVLDTRDLDIRAVYLDDQDPTPFELGAEQPYLGKPLTIKIAKDTEIVHIDYASSPGAAALQWLEPAQTAGKKHPFLFSQSQAILARTWVPCQDTPSVRFTYSAKITGPKELMALMSAENPTARTADGVYRFQMPQPIPSYLLAIAVGDVAFKSLGARSGVYSEPSVLDGAAWELADTEKMIDVVEKLYGPYRWGRYDLLVLPPSFPFGGMENPRLTFATPTILAGDRSLVALVAHELAHSWSGNLVTNATWGDFWLNEGFTTYVEYRVMEELYGNDYAEMLRALAEQGLRNTIAELGEKSADTQLVFDLKGRDPDDGSGDIAYEKGSLFLRSIEAIVGRAKFDAFLRGYFDRNAFKPTTNADFERQLESELIRGDQALRDKLQVAAWIHGPGLPSNAKFAQPTLFQKVDAEIAAWKDGKKKAKDLAVAKWSTHEWMHFLRGLPKPLSAAQMAELDAAFGLNKKGNSEVLFCWLEHVIASEWEPGYDALHRFLTGQGRRKFLKPLYEQMAAKPTTKPLAEKIYRKARPGYHPVSYQTVDAILGVKAE